MTSNPFHRRYVLLAFAGLLFSSVLLYHHVEVLAGPSIGPSFCSFNETFDCDAVAKSSYSVAFGIPVASWALIYYFALLLYLVGRDAKPGETREGDVMLPLSIITAIPTAIMFAVSLFIIKKICIYCSILYLTNLIILILAFKDPSRSRPISQSVTQGIKAILVLPLRMHEELLLIVCFLAFTAVVLVAPEKIIGPFLRRYQIHDTDLVTRKLIYNTWNAGVAEQLNLNLTGDPASRDWSKGAENPTATIVEYFDYECPHCKNFGLVAEELLQQYPNDLRLVVKNFPLDPSCNRYTPKAGHLMSCKLAATARCLGQINPELFWAFNHKIYNLPSVDMARLQSILGDLSVSKDQVEACLAKPETIERIKADTDEGFALKIDHTPTIFINNKRIDSAEFSRIKTILEQVIANARAANNSEGTGR